MKLFCVPYSGGNAYSYSEFKRFLPEPIEFYNLELPGRGTRALEPLLDTIDAMTEDLCRQMEDKLNSDYAIFGHSLGALLAYTTCKCLQRKGFKSPKILFVSGQGALSLSENKERYLLPDDRFADLLLEMGGTPEELLMDKDFCRYFLPIIKADFKAIEQYHYRPDDVKLSLPVVVLAGTKEDISDEAAGLWREETDGECSLHRFEGGHFFIHERTADVCRLIADKCLLT